MFGGKGLTSYAQFGLVKILYSHKRAVVSLALRSHPASPAQTGILAKVTFPGLKHFLCCLLGMMSPHWSLH